MQSLDIDVIVFVILVMLLVVVVFIFGVLMGYRAAFEEERDKKEKEDKRNVRKHNSKS